MALALTSRWSGPIWVVEPLVEGTNVKGAIFNIFEDFVIANHGDDVYYQILDGANLETTDPFVGPATYPADDLFALVGSAMELLGVEIDDLLRPLGRFAFPILARSIPTMMAEFDSVESFLLGLESVIHTEVRKLDPEASPARFAVERRTDGDLFMSYESPFGLFALVSGLLDGLGDWYADPFEHEMVASEGTNATFRIGLTDPVAVGGGASTGQGDA